MPKNAASLENRRSIPGPIPLSSPDVFRRSLLPRPRRPACAARAAHGMSRSPPRNAGRNPATTAPGAPQKSDKRIPTNAPSPLKNRRSIPGLTPCHRRTCSGDPSFRVSAARLAPRARRTACRVSPTMDRRTKSGDDRPGRLQKATNEYQRLPANPRIRHSKESCFTVAQDRFASRSRASRKATNEYRARPTNETPPPRCKIPLLR